MHMFDLSRRCTIPVSDSRPSVKVLGLRPGIKVLRVNVNSLQVALKLREYH